MNAFPGNRFRLAAGVAVAALALLSGCSGASTAASLPARGDGYAAPQADQMPEGAPDTAIEPRIARTASITMVVSDVAQSADALHGVASDVAGSVTSESLSLSDDNLGSCSSVQITVPSARLDEALGLIAKLGEVTAQQIDATDVTDQVVDVDARVATMRESIKRLQELMSKSGSVADIASVEAQLTQRQADLESLLARQKALSQSVETSPIAVSLCTTAPDNKPDATDGFLPGLQAGWNSLVSAGGVALTVLGALLPWLALAAIVVVLIVALRRHHRRAKAAAAALKPRARSHIPHPATPPQGSAASQPASAADTASSSVTPTDGTSETDEVGASAADEGSTAGTPKSAEKKAETSSADE